MSFSFTETRLEELEARHRKETKELTSKVMALKKSVPKGDKRKKKEVAAEIAILESQLSEQHNNELHQFKANLSAQNIESEETEQSSGIDNNNLLVDSMKNASIDDANAEIPNANSGLYGGSSGMRKVGSSGKKNKAKQRLQRRAEELRRIQEEAEQEAAKMEDPGALENTAMNVQLARDGLEIHEIRPDGHCLYSAFADQLDQSLSYSDVRRHAATYMREHSDDFMPFMAHENGDMFSEEDFVKYCDDVENSAVWGGQQEITALSHALSVPVLVYQSDAPILRIGEDMYKKEPVRLSYHRHAYGLGEHYNSLHKIDSSDQA